MAVGLSGVTVYVLGKKLVRCHLRPEQPCSNSVYCLGAQLMLSVLPDMQRY